MAPLKETWTTLKKMIWHHAIAKQSGKDKQPATDKKADK